MSFPIADSNGCVNVRWPSKNVPYGGVFHIKKADTITKEDQQFIRELINEQKFNALQKKSTWKLRDYPKVEPISGTKLGPLLKEGCIGKRTLATIRSSGDLDTTPFQPNPVICENRGDLKRRLQDIMQFGERPLVQKFFNEQRRATNPPALPSPRQSRQDLITQIRERVEWLEAMEKLGEAKPHKAVINGQINERLRQIESLGLDSPKRSSRSDNSVGSDLFKRVLKAATAKAAEKTSARRSNEDEVESVYSFEQALMLRKEMSKYR